jgi:predicted PilT family ATPase
MVKKLWLFQSLKKIIIPCINNKAIVYVPESLKAKIIGKQGSNIDSIEKRLGIKVDIKTKKNIESIPFDILISKGHIKFFTNFVNTSVNIYVDNDFLMTAKISKKGQVSIKKSNALAKILTNAESEGKKIELRI